MRREEQRAFYICISPWIVGFLLFTSGPLAYLFFVSLTDMHNVGIPYQFVGISNYLAMVRDPTFWLSLGNTVYYVGILVPASLCVSLAAAVLLNQRLPLRDAFRTIFYVPVITPLVASSVLWLWLLTPNSGLVDQILSLLGVHGPAWLADPAWAKLGLIIMGLWGGVGGQMVIFLAALQGVPTDLLEAAHVDGASVWQRFWRITIPMISPAIFFNVVIGIIATFQVFTAAFIMTNGGPLQATLFYVLYIFQSAFESYNLGYAAALSWVLLVLLLGLTLLQFRYLTRFVTYER